MKPAGLIAREDAVRKPPHGCPCNRCGGVCCMVTLCAIALALLLVTGAAHAGECPDGTDGCDNEASPASLWEGSWQDCYSHNLPERPACVGRPCEGNWPGPKDQCGPKAQSPRWLARTEAQRERCRRHISKDGATYKQIIRFDRCMQRYRKRNNLGGRR